VVHSMRCAVLCCVVCQARRHILGGGHRDLWHTRGYSLCSSLANRNNAKARNVPSRSARKPSARPKRCSKARKPPKLAALSPREATLCPHPRKATLVERRSPRCAPQLWQMQTAPPHWLPQLPRRLVVMVPPTTSVPRSVHSVAATRLQNWRRRPCLPRAMPHQWGAARPRLALEAALAVELGRNRRQARNNRRPRRHPSSPSR